MGARQIGLQDAWASGGSAAVTQYMELALQALVLSYGGLAILSGSTELTIGNLITFQLYWAMLSGAFNGISDQINSFVKVRDSTHSVPLSLRSCGTDNGCATGSRCGSARDSTA